MVNERTHPNSKANRVFNKRSWPTHLLTFLILAAPALPILADAFPPITAEERALTKVPGRANAPAVMIYERAEIKIMDYPKEVFSYLEGQARIKILLEEGKKYGEIEIEHGAFHRLASFEGRTVLPDGRVVPLGKEAVFREERSQRGKRFVTKAAFPAVEVGAIIDYKYTFRWDSFLYLGTWTFHHRIPTLFSEITYFMPPELKIIPWTQETTANKIQLEADSTARGTKVRAWMENLRAIPDEPHSFPFADMASRFMLIPNPTEGKWPAQVYWRKFCEAFDLTYLKFRHDNRQVKMQAAQIVSGLGSRREQAVALYDFVRDEIRTVPPFWILPAKASADKVLAERQGTTAEKALLLQAMLSTIKVKSRPVWAPDRSSGRADLNVPNLAWFDRVLLRVELDGERLFLDPCDDRLGFGRLAPDSEGAQAVVHHKSKPEIITLPVTSHDQNVRRAVIDLDLDDEGRISGHGSLLLTGHHAWRRLRWKQDEEETAEAWQDWLEDAYEGYEVSGVTVEESPDEQQVRIAWSLAQRPEEVLGDESSLEPSLPLGPVGQAFTLPAKRRQTPVQLSFGDRDEIELSLTWPEDWEVDLLPEAKDFSSEAGALVAGVELDEPGRRLTFTRRFDIKAREFFGKDQYVALQDLYSEVEKTDAQDLVLVLR